MKQIRVDKEKQLLVLIEKWTRAEIAARLPEYVLPGQDPQEVTSSMWHTKVEREDDIRKAVFGTDCLVEIGAQLGMLKRPDPKADKKERRQSKKKQLKVGRRARR